MRKAKHTPHSIEYLKTKDLVPSPWNRDGNTTRSLATLKASIEASGILQPIIVRKCEGDYQIVAGHRRHAAALALGLDKVPCIVKDLTDEQAIRLQVIENLQRENLNPVEEALIFQRLADAWGVVGNNYARIGEIVNKPQTYVVRSLRLLELPKSFLRLIEQGKLTAEHGHQVLRVGPEQQDAIITFATTPGWNKHLPTVNELKAEIDRTASLPLKLACFPTTIEYAGVVACTECQFNTGNQNSLFDGATDGTCTNRDCYGSKTRHFNESLVEKGKKAWPGLRYVGIGKENPYGAQRIKSYVVVESDALGDRVKKALDETPDRFGFGILNPIEGGRLKKPRIVLLAKEDAPEEEKASQDRPKDIKPETDEEKSKRLFVEAGTRIFIARKLIDSVDFKTDIDSCIISALWDDRYDTEMDGILAACGVAANENTTSIEIETAINVLPPELRTKLLFWCLVLTHPSNTMLVDDILQHVGSDIDDIRKQGIEEAEKAYDAKIGNLAEPA